MFRSCKFSVLKSASHDLSAIAELLVTVTFITVVFKKNILLSTDADPRSCTPDAPEMCHEYATCTRKTPYTCACNPASSYRCECNQGFIGDGLTCTGESQPAITENVKKCCPICNILDQLRNYMLLFVTPALVGERGMVMSMSVCLSVCLFVSRSQEPSDQTSFSFLCESHLPQTWHHLFLVVLHYIIYFRFCGYRHIRQYM